MVEDALEGSSDVLLALDDGSALRRRHEVQGQRGDLRRDDEENEVERDPDPDPLPAHGRGVRGHSEEALRTRSALTWLRTHAPTTAYMNTAGKRARGLPQRLLPCIALSTVAKLWWRCFTPTKWSTAECPGPSPRSMTKHDNKA